MALGDGTVQDRYDRDYLRLLDTRKQRAMDHRRDDRRTREYVDPDTIAVAGDGTVTGTVTDVGDNDNGVVTVNPA